MTQFAYLVGLIIAIVGTAAFDYRYKLAYWHNKKATIRTLSTVVAVFIVWDLLGIMLGIFFAGRSDYFLPIRLLPEFPIEELFFLTLLCYTTLVLYRFGVTRWPRT